MAPHDDPVESVTPNQVPYATHSSDGHRDGVAYATPVTDLPHDDDAPHIHIAPGEDTPDDEHDYRDVVS